MKTLMQMNAEEGKGVVFFESCINLKQQRHTTIEAVPVPWELFDVLPGYFQVRRQRRLALADLADHHAYLPR